MDRVTLLLSCFLLAIGVTSAFIIPNQKENVCNYDGLSRGNLPRLSANQLKKKVHDAPKAELHIHVDGTLEPEMAFAIGARNNISLPYPDVDALKKAYNFTDLGHFLYVLDVVNEVITYKRDFYEMAAAYLHSMAKQNIRHCELLFAVSTQIARGIEIKTLVEGFNQALQEAEATYGMTGSLIFGFLRHETEDKALEIFNEALPLFSQYSRLNAVGLVGAELGNPPSKFKNLFSLAKSIGLRLAIHAGETGPAAYVADAIDNVKTDRVDHGVRAIEDPQLVKRIADMQMPLDVCPLSNVRLRVIEHLGQLPLLQFLDAGVLVTISSDDPAFFGGYLQKNFEAIIDTFALNDRQLYTLLCNSFRASFITSQRRSDLIGELNNYWF